MIIRSSSLDHGMRTPITAYQSQIRSLMDCSGLNRKSTSLSLLRRNWWNDHTCSSLLLTCQSSSISCSLTLLMHSKVSTLLIRHLWTIHLETIPWIHCHHSLVLNIILYCRQLRELTFFVPMLRNRLNLTTSFGMLSPPSQETRSFMWTNSRLSTILLLVFLLSNSYHVINGWHSHHDQCYHC